MSEKKRTKSAVVKDCIPVATTFKNTAQTTDYDLIEERSGRAVTTTSAQYNATRFGPSRASSRQIYER